MTKKKRKKDDSAATDVSHLIGPSANISIETQKEKQGCILEEPEKSIMQRMFEMGAAHLIKANTFAWHSMRDHAKECEFCCKRFEMLFKEAIKNGQIDDPTILH